MTNSQFKILLVDDEPDILEFLSYNLKKEGFLVETANNGRDALKMAASFKPHLIVLDVMMPQMDGMETCEKLRSDAQFSDVLIAFLTARGEDYSQIAGFEAGADDYISKPIKPKVFISRIKALLKRSIRLMKEQAEVSDKVINVANLSIDRERYLVIQDGKEFSLPRKEFELLILLVSKPGRVFARDEIYSAIWGEKIIVGDRTIDVHIRKLREKIGENYIQTVKGVGYKFVNIF